MIVFLDPEDYEKDILSKKKSSDMRRNKQKDSDFSGFKTDIGFYPQKNRHKKAGKL